MLILYKDRWDLGTTGASGAWRRDTQAEWLVRHPLDLFTWTTWSTPPGEVINPYKHRSVPLVRPGLKNICTGQVVGPASSCHPLHPFILIIWSSPPGEIINVFRDHFRPLVRPGHRVGQCKLSGWSVLQWIFLSGPHGSLPQGR